MMWAASVNAICDRAHGTGFTASTRRQRGEHRAPLQPIPEVAVISRIGGVE